MHESIQKVSNFYYICNRRPHCDGASGRRSATSLRRTFWYSVRDKGIEDNSSDKRNAGNTFLLLFEIMKICKPYFLFSELPF